MAETSQKPTTRTWPIWLAVAVGWLVQLGLKTLLPIVVLVAVRSWSLQTNDQAMGLDNPDDSSYPIWYAMQGAVFIGSVIAGGFAAMLAPRRPVMVSIALVILSLVATAFEQFPRPLTTTVVWIWTVGPCAGLVVGVLLGRWLTRGDDPR
jgi:hypothetical protein